MSANNHLVFGAGLIGGYLAGGLLAAGFTTSLVARDRVRDAMSGGLTISDYTGNSKSMAAPRFINAENPADESFDFLWLTVKCTAVAGLMDELAALVSPTTVILCCQNGLGSDDALRQAYPGNSILRAVVGFNVTGPESGQLHRSTEGKLVIESSPLVSIIIEKLDSPFLPVAGSDDIVAEQWAKLQLNVANPVNALANIPVKTMTEKAGYRRIIAALMRELLNVSKALSLDLPKVTAVPARWIPRLLALPDGVFKLLAQKMLAIDPTARTSMWWDLSGGRVTEIDFLNGAVVREADKLGIACPVNRRIVQLVHQVEAGQQTIGLSAEALAAILFDTRDHA
ncbi:MAG: 2-dehydropantoate 2-reductase [Gammaproteobacteria bacterium]|nr:2-dehydropantoate 2-reductase [Gammaproteobacteria bacterium]